MSTVILPEWLLEMAQQMKEQPNRSTAHPFWQVRCTEYIPTEAGYNDHHWILADDEGQFYRSDTQELTVAADYLSENYTDWFQSRVQKAKETKGDGFYEGSCDIDIFADSFDFYSESLPDDIETIFVQEVEKVVSTHLTEADANWFIGRKQHDYPKLYTYVESAYWSPQLKQLQDWIIAQA